MPKKILREDPDLAFPENAGLRRYIDRKISEIMLEDDAVKRGSGREERKWKTHMCSH